MMRRPIGRDYDRGQLAGVGGGAGQFIGTDWMGGQPDASGKQTARGRTMQIRKVPASWLDSPRQAGRKSVRSRVRSEPAGDIGAGKGERGQNEGHEALDEQAVRDARHRAADSRLGTRGVAGGNVPARA